MPVGSLPLALPEMTIRTSTDVGARAVRTFKRGRPLVSNVHPRYKNGLMPHLSDVALSIEALGGAWALRIRVKLKP